MKKFLVAGVSLIALQAAVAAPNMTPQWGWDSTQTLPTGTPLQYKIGTTWTAMPLLAQNNVWSGTQLFQNNVVAQKTSTAANSIYSAIYPSVTFSDTIQSVADITAGTTTINNTGLAAYVKNASGTNGAGQGNGVGLFAAVQSVANNSSVWGVNTLCQDAPTRAIASLTGNYCIGAELDFNIMSPATQVIGVSVGGNSLSQPTTSNAFIVNSLGTGIKWGGGFVSLSGTTNTGLSLGAKSASGTNIESQNLQLGWFDGSATAQLTLIRMTSGYLSITNSGAWNGVALAGNLTVQSPYSAIFAGGASITGAYAGSFTNGVAVDYVSPFVRFSGGAGDSFVWYNGGIGAAQLMLLSSTGNLLLGKTSTTTGSLSLANASSAYTTTLQAGANTPASWTLTLPLAVPAANGAILTATTGGVSSWTSILPVANGGTNCSASSITCFNNITGYTATGATGTTSTNLVFSTSPTITTPTISGNETYTGTAGRILADFDNATVNSRRAFQTSTTNATTGIYALPNGTSTAASWQATNNSDPTNASKILIATNASTDVQLVSGINGTGTYLPLSIYTSGGQSAQFSTTKGTFTLGVAGTATGVLNMTGATSGTATITAQAAAGTPTLTLPNTSGTLVSTASAPLSISSTTGAISITGAAGQILAGATPAFTATPTLGVNATTTGQLGLANGGATGATVTVQNNGATTAYNFNLPTTVGTAGYLLTSQAGGASAMTWTSPTTTVNGQSCTLGSTCTVTAVASSIPFPATVSGTVTSGGIPYFSSTTAMASSALLAQYQLVVGGGAGAAPATLGATGSAGQHLQSGGAAANPSWTTATFPATTTAGTILASGTANTVTATATPTLGVQSTTAGTLTLANTNAGAFPTTLASSASSTAAWTLTLPVATPAANGAVLTSTTGGVSSWVTSLPVANGGTACTAASITCFNNITGFTASGTTGTTSTNLVFSTSPTLVTPVLGAATGTSLALGGATIGTNALAVTGTTALSSTLTSAAHTITSSSANALAVGANGTTNPALNVDASTASSATGLNIKSAAAGNGVALSVISSGTNETLTIDSKGTGNITIGNNSTGNIYLQRSTTVSNAFNQITSTQYQGYILSNGTYSTVTFNGLSATNDNGTMQLLSAGAAKVNFSADAAISNYLTKALANSFSVGPNGTTNPAFNVDTSTASSATGLNIKSAAAGSGVALSTISSGTNENLTLDAKGSGTIGIGATSTGNVGIGTNSPSYGVQIVKSIPNLILSDNAGTNTTKYAMMGVANYSGLSGTPVAIFGASSDATNNIIAFGGGYSQQYAATSIQFNTAANTTTTIGTNRMAINSSGNVNLSANIASTSTSSGTLTVSGGIGASGAIYGGGVINAATSVQTAAASPTITTCGTSPSVTTGSSNNSGQITTGSTATTACTITFATAYPTSAYCTVSPVNAANSGLYISAQSASAFTITYTSATSAKFQYTCFGN